ncbi:MAG TPA: flagellar motor switch protein FliN [Aeromonadales bacterium]|nr:flagellar motor switch protein FliN [Aeromonadales bacterium]
MSDEKDAASSDADWGDAMAEQSAAEAEQAQMDQLVDEGVPADDSAPIDDEKLGVILDIPVTLSMEVGRTDIAIRNLLQLNQGSVVELERLAGEPLDVLVNGTLIAHGEVVVVNEKFGIRLTDVMSPSERIKKLS